MASNKKKSPAEELLDTLISEVGPTKVDAPEGVLELDSGDEQKDNILGTTIHLDEEESEESFRDMFNVSTSLAEEHPETTNQNTIASKSKVDSEEATYLSKTKNAYEATRVEPVIEKTDHGHVDLLDLADSDTNKANKKSKNKQTETLDLGIKTQAHKQKTAIQAKPDIDQPIAIDQTQAFDIKSLENLSNEPAKNVVSPKMDISEPTNIINYPTDVKLNTPNESTLAANKPATNIEPANTYSEKTVAITGFQIKPEENIEDKVRVSVGQQGRSTGFVSWGGGADSQLSHSENLRIAQEKILELENENERLRRQNEEIISASDILKERADLLTAQLSEFKNDRDGLEQSFKNEMTLLKNHLNRKEADLQKALFKIDELESRLKFDMKKIRVRERELENRLELVRAEKNAISKNKDEQILDLRRKMDVAQLEVDSYRQKCVELNKQIENSQDSFKRTTRALRLAMANLELQEENKVPIKKAE